MTHMLQFLQRSIISLFRQHDKVRKKSIAGLPTPPADRKEHLLMECEQRLPSYEVIAQWLQSYKRLTITYTTMENDYVKNLRAYLPDYALRSPYDKNELHITPNITSEEILEKKLIIYQCAQHFRQDAFKLMNLLSVTFGINLVTLDGLHALKFKKGAFQRGAIDDAWNYHLHGSECLFENNYTGQEVEVIVVTPPEFGYLDPYFFYNYMATTEQFKQLAAWFDHDSNKVREAIEFLAEEGTLTTHPDLWISRNIIAL